MSGYMRLETGREESEVRVVAESDSPILIDLPALLAHFGVATTEELVEVVIDNEVESIVELFRDEDNEWVVLYMTTPNAVHHSGMVLDFPMTEASFWELVHDLDEQVMGVKSRDTLASGLGSAVGGADSHVVEAPAEHAGTP